MAFIWAAVLLSFLAFISTSETREAKPYNRTFCDKSIRSLQTDCSFMLGAPPGSCVIHHTNSCRTYSYDSWDLAPEHQVKSLDKLDYRISLSTYKFEGLTLNVSIDTLSKDVRGLTFSLLEYSYPNEQNRYNTCRIFDFRGFSAEQTVSLYYDCYYRIQADISDAKYFLLTARGLPTNHVGIFYVTLSTSPDKKGGETLCNWESTIMILEPALANGDVIALFSTAPAAFNISKYDVALFEDGPSGPDLTAQLTVVDDMHEGVMKSVEFPRRDGGAYHIEIHPIHPDWEKEPTCSITKTDTFVIISVSHFEVVLVASIISVILILMILAGALFYIYIKRRKPDATRQSSVFLLYSYDSDCHFEKVRALYDFLTDVPGLAVAFDVAEANEMGVPHMWLTNQLHNADHILLVVSTGVYDKVEESKRPLHEHHPWGDQVYSAVLEIIHDERLHNKLIKVI
ncbi:unnamed protein product, partial [Ixodes hexagonus]